MKIANWVLAEIPRRRPKKQEKAEKVEVKPESEVTTPHFKAEVRQNEESDEDSGCCCFAFFSNKKKTGTKEPLLIND